MQSSPPIEERFLVARIDDPSAIDERVWSGDLLDVLRVVRREQDRACSSRTTSISSARICVAPPGRVRWLVEGSSRGAVPAPATATP